MSYSRIQQANQPLEHDIAPNPQATHSIPHTLRGHVQEDFRNQPAAGNIQFGDPLANIYPPADENVVTQRYPQDPHYIDVVHHDRDMPVPVGYYPRPQLGGPLPQDPALQYMYHDAGVAQDIPVQPQAIRVQAAPEIQGHSDFYVDYAPQLLVPGPARAEHPDPWAYNTPVRDYPPADNLRCLARRYVDHPNSQVDVVRIEPGHAGRFKVVITLETPDFL